MKGCRPLTDFEIATVKGAFTRTRDKALFIAPRLENWATYFRTIESEGRRCLSVWAAG